MTTLNSKEKEINKRRCLTFFLFCGGSEVSCELALSVKSSFFNDCLRKSQFRLTELS